MCFDISFEDHWGDEKKRIKTTKQPIGFCRKQALAASVVVVARVNELRRKK